MLPMNLYFSHFDSRGQFKAMMELIFRAKIFCRQNISAQNFTPRRKLPSCFDNQFIYVASIYLPVVSYTHAHMRQ